MARQGTVLITGANGGLGASFVSQFFKSSPPYLGLFTVRSLSGESSQTLTSLVSGSKHPVSIVPVDLSSLTAVREFAREINAKVSSGEIPRIRALILNAAVQHVHGPVFTKDGFETMFAVNYLTNFLLVLLLLESMDRERGRIVIVSSFSHDPAVSYNRSYHTEKMIFTDPEKMARPAMNDTPGDEWKAGMRRYGLSKMLLLMLMYFPLGC
jgi:NAD(P)-dependent dehydrogenase (short-subunit alcohol dehydrogenase family)